MSDLDQSQQDPQPESQPQEDHFYVGYLPTPEPHRRLMTLLVTLLTLWVISVATVIVLTQRTPGRAVWDTSMEREWSGVLIAEPYPMLLPDTQDNPAPLLVVSMGKVGAQEALKGAYGHRVTLRGFELRREGRHMIELIPDSSAVTIADPADPGEIPTIQPVSERTIELVGEIIDGKCYLGAMKPGDGFGHRACAALCLRGGLPPMFVSESDIGGILYPLLIVDGSTTLEDDVIGLVASRVRIQGQMAVIAGLPVITARSEDIELVSNERGMMTHTPASP